jgi:hypothetical protein
MLDAKARDENGDENEVEQDLKRKEASQKMRESRMPLPAGFRFDRDEANER